jgi:hypothetical protein
MDISIYSSAFNLLKNKFNFIEAINNFCLFAEEIVICVNSSDDDTFEELNKLKSYYSNLIIIESNFSYEDPLLDGKIKNKALQATTNEIKIGLDMDEYIPLWQKLIWKKLAFNLKFDYNSDCYMIPSINLYKNINNYFSITPKWYLHKSNLYRGAVNFAKKDNGTVDTSKSDTCELIDENGNLVKYSQVTPFDIDSLRTKDYPFVIHNGYLDLNNRLLRNKNFWEDHWKIESGGQEPQHKVHKSLEDFQENYQEHKLKI